MHFFYGINLWYIIMKRGDFVEFIIFRPDRGQLFFINTPTHKKGMVGISKKNHLSTYS